MFDMKPVIIGYGIFCFLILLRLVVEIFQQSIIGGLLITGTLVLGAIVWCIIDYLE